MKFSELEIDQFFLFQDPAGDYYAFRKADAEAAHPVTRTGRTQKDRIKFSANDDVAVYS